MVRNYTDEPIDPATLDKIAMSALRAPSAGNSQGLGVVVITDSEVRRRLANLAGEDVYVAAGFDPWISAAPAHVVVSVSEKVYRDRYSEPDKLGSDGEPIEWPVPFWWVDAGAALMAILLAAVDEGLGAGFLGVHSVPALAEAIGLPDDQMPIGIVTVGHPAHDRRSSSLDRKPRDENVTVHHDRWQA